VKVLAADWQGSGAGHHRDSDGGHCIFFFCENFMFSYICGGPLYTFSDDCNNGATTYLFLGGVIILVANFMALLLVGSKKIAEMVI
jgi:hypothetical protein